MEGFNVFSLLPLHVTTFKILISLQGVAQDLFHELFKTIYSIFQEDLKQQQLVFNLDTG